MEKGERIIVHGAHVNKRPKQEKHRLEAKDGKNNLVCWWCSRCSALSSPSHGRRLCAWNAMHRIKMVKSSLARRRRMMETLTYGWSGWDVIYGTDAVGINLTS